MDMEKLILDMKKGDMSALEQIYNMYINEAFKYVYLITGNVHTSEDVCQEAFIKCYKSIKSLKNPNSFKPWFFKLLTRLSWKAVKKDAKSLPKEDVVNLYDKLNTEDNDLSYKYDFLYEKIDLLNIKLKTTVILFYFNDMSIGEIAKAMNCLEPTVKTRLYNARKILKKSIENEKEECLNERFI